MNFTPFYYHVQDLIIKDDDKSIKKIFEDIEQQEEFKSYYEDFIHCTYPNSFKCLYYLMNEVHLRYDIHSIFTHAIKDNNIEWLDFFFEKFYSDWVTLVIKPVTLVVKPVTLVLPSLIMQKF